MSYLPLHDICVHFFYHVLLRQVLLAVTQNSGEDHYKLNSHQQLQAFSQL